MKRFVLTRRATGWVALVCALVACGEKPAPSPPAPAPEAPAAPSGSGTVPTAAAAGPLKGVCPDKIVIQIDWFATPERAAAFQLIGSAGSVDKKRGTYAGPLVGGGVDVEVRLGGPFIGFQPVPALMYQEKVPTLAVVAPLDINPQVVMWDPGTYTINAWADVAKTKAKLIYIEGLPFMDYLVSKGYVTPDQKDASFDGTPSRFVAERGKPIQQGYASNEPYRWEHDVEGWKKPVKFLLVHDSGYEIYPQGLAVRSAQLGADRACLKLLVPMIQKAQLAYMNDPAPTNAALLKIAQTLGDGPPVTAAGNANAVVVMKDLHIAGNGSDGTLGNFDLTRVERTIGVLKPIFAARGAKVPPQLKAADIVSNEFIDPALHL
jgi:hypothetical protein